MGHDPSRYLIWGAGGHGQVVADVVRAIGSPIVGYVDADPSRLESTAGNFDTALMLHEDELVEHVLVHGRLPSGADALALGVGNNEARVRFLSRLEGVPVPPLVHPHAVLGTGVELGLGSVVMPGVVINANSIVSTGVIVNTGAVVEHDCWLEAGVHIAPGAILSGGARIGARSLIGAGAIVLPRIEVGADATVGAGGVVVRNVPPGTMVMGVPARPR